MTTPTSDAVIAGSKAFALALLAPLTERVGTRPRVAADPIQAVDLCREGGLLVFEFQGEGSLRAIQDLVLQGTDLQIVAAVPEAHAAAEGSLRALGIDLGRWDGKPDGVLGAVARRLSRVQAYAAAAAKPRPQPAAAPVAQASPPPSPPAPDEPASASAPGATLFDDLAADEFEVDLAEGERAPVVPPAPAPAAGPWPMNVPGPAEAADALARALAGLFDPPGSPFAAVADVVGGLSDLERAVLAGDRPGVEVEPIRRAVVMRVRAAAALATAPAPGVAVDGGAVSALLAEIDALLSDVNTLAQSAPAELQPGLEEVRNALVKEAIDFSEAAHRAAPSDPIPPATPTAIRGKATQTRIVAVSSQAEQEVERAQTRRQTRLFVVLGVSLALAAAFHGYRYWDRNAYVAHVVRVPGAPANSVAVEHPGAPLIIRSSDGSPFSEEEKTALREKEALKGNRVEEPGPGILVVVPGGAAAPAEARQP